MEIGDIEIAFYDIKEQLEVNAVRVDRIEERIDPLEKDMRRVLVTMKDIRELMILLNDERGWTEE